MLTLKSNISPASRPDAVVFVSARGHFVIGSAARYIFTATNDGEQSIDIPGEGKF